MVRRHHLCVHPPPRQPSNTLRPTSATSAPGVVPGLMRRSLILIAGLLCAAAQSAPAEARPRGVGGTLYDLRAAGRLTGKRHEMYAREWRRARRAVRRLHGPARSNLAGVLANTSALGQAGLLPERLTPAFLTVGRNYIVLRRLGMADPAAGQLRATQRVGQREGQRPGHTRGVRRRAARSGCSTTRLLALGCTCSRSAAEALAGSRAWLRPQGCRRWPECGAEPGEARFRRAGERMTGAFFTPPPWGVRLRRGGGRSHYLLYSQSPRLLVGNGFAQSTGRARRVRRHDGQPSRRAGTPARVAAGRRRDRQVRHRFPVALLAPACHAQGCRVRSALPPGLQGLPRRAVPAVPSPGFLRPA